MEIAGQVQMDRGIARFSDGVADYRPIWPMVEEEFYAEIKLQFRSEGEEGGDKWAELTPEYAGWKEIHYPGAPILQRTGDLVKSLTSSTDANAVLVEARKTLTLGSRLEYARYHQTGTRNKDGSPRMAARPEIQLTEVFKRKSMNHIHTYLVQIASQSGFRQGLGPLDVSRLSGWARQAGIAGSSGGELGRFRGMLG